MNEAAIPLDDRGLLLGDGLFETVLWRDGEPVFWDRHLARLCSGASALGLPAPIASDVEAAAYRAAAKVAQGRAAIRISYTAGSGGRGIDRPLHPAPRLFATAALSPRPDGPVTLALADVRRNEQSPTSRLKTLAYIDNVLARRQAQASGADEALMLNTQGAVACAAAANVFWLSDNVLSTPSLESGVLDGIVRGEVLRQARAMGLMVREVAAPIEDLQSAASAFITNSLIGVRPVLQLGDKAFEFSRAVERLAVLLT